MGKIPSASERLLAQALMLPKRDRARLADAIVKSIEKDVKSGDFTKEQKAELDRRLAATRRDPSAGSTWDEVEARIRGKR
jgi:putative addiction module component (TIGR02574 family)